MTAHYHVKTLGVQNLVMCKCLFSVPGWRRSPHCGADGGGGDWGSDISATVFGRGGWGCCECGLFTGSAARRSQCRIWARCQSSLSTVHVPLRLKLQWSSLFLFLHVPLAWRGIAGMGLSTKVQISVSAKLMWGGGGGGGGGSCLLEEEKIRGTKKEEGRTGFSSTPNTYEKYSEHVHMLLLPVLVA